MSLKAQAFKLYSQMFKFEMEQFKTRNQVKWQNIKPKEQLFTRSKSLMSPCL